MVRPFEVKDWGLIQKAWELGRPQRVKTGLECPRCPHDPHPNRRCNGLMHGGYTGPYGSIIVVGKCRCKYGQI